jgi:hypothetical protein
MINFLWRLRHTIKEWCRRLGAWLNHMRYLRVLQGGLREDDSGHLISDAFNANRSLMVGPLGSVEARLVGKLAGGSLVSAA